MLKYLRGRSFGYIFRFVLAAPLALFIWLAIEIINIFRPVYIVGLSYKGRITQYMAPMELHLRNANQLNKKYKMIFVMPAATPNEAVRTIYRRYALIIDSHFPNLIRRSFAILAQILKTRFTPELPTWNTLWELEPATKLSKNELEFGSNLRKQLGIPDGAQYVCLSVKDGAYYTSITPERGYGQDIRHQAHDSRNPKMSSYLETATYLAQKNLYVLRMGSIVSDPLPTIRHKNIIDYAFDHRSELGDLVLYRNCLFELNGTAGTFVFAASFNVPIVQCDEYEIDAQSQTNHPIPAILMLSLIKESVSGRLLSIREILSLGKAGRHDAHIKQLGLERLNNSPDEILSGVKELENFVLGQNTLNHDDKLLQRKFYNCYNTSLDPDSQRLVTISPSFLRKYQDLL